MLPKNQTLLTPSGLNLSIAGAIVATLISIPLIEISPWIPSGFFIFGFSVSHFLSTTKKCLPLPQTAVLIATIYYLFAPIASFYYPPKNLLYSILDFHEYFQFAVPCIWATAVGWYFALAKLPSLELSTTLPQRSPQTYVGLDLLIVFGLFVSFLATLTQLPSSAKTLAMLLANTRYIGAFGWMLLGRTGWKGRLALVMTLDLYSAASTGFFLDFLLWTLNAAVIYSFRNTIKPRYIAGSLVCIVFFLPCFQHAKWELRKASWGVGLADQRLTVFGTTYPLTSANKPFLLAAKVLESGYQLTTGQENAEFISDTVIRYNQGWIISRVLAHVPAFEPFANGTTVIDAAIASVVPRAIMNNKVQSGGGANFTRYTGVQLNSSTSMNLGFVGEMYANFGYYGGIIGVGFYALILGLIYRYIVLKSVGNILLLTFVPYVLNFAVVSEVGLVEVLNYTVKSIFVAGFLLYISKFFLPDLFHSKE